MTLRAFCFGIFILCCYSHSFSKELKINTINTPIDDSLDYNFFSPNNDSINDYFIIENIQDYRDYNKLSVFNRWGDLVYEASPYNNNWDGTSNQKNKFLGTELPEGVYIYRFEFKIADKSTSKYGKITLKR